MRNGRGAYLESSSAARDFLRWVKDGVGVGVPDEEGLQICFPNSVSDPQTKWVRLAKFEFLEIGPIICSDLVGFGWIWLDFL